MKKTILLLAIVPIVLASTAMGQQKAETKRAQSVYFEASGPGVLYSLNYDARFQHRQDGIGGRIGASFFSVSGESLVTLPVMLNYLLGKNGRYFEVGLGATFYDNNNNGDDTLASAGRGLLGTMVFGYRSQPLDGGFMFRAGFAPIFDDENFIPYYPYLSLGYSF